MTALQFIIIAATGFIIGVVLTMIYHRVRANRWLKAYRKFSERNDKK